MNKGVRRSSRELNREVEIREAFRVLDRDGNGFISKQELGMAMRSLGYMPSEVELAIIMQRLDMDGDGQVDFDEFMTILGPKLVSSEGRDGFLGNTIDSIFWQVTLGSAHLPQPPPITDTDSARSPLTSMHSARPPPRANWIPGVTPAPFPICHALMVTFSYPSHTLHNDSSYYEVHSQKQNRQTCVRKSLICAFAMAFIISVMLIAANQILRSGME
ncbi:hypothetical protein A6R68_16259 [Neotoma lepida]|uniref:EF-hand domain-containing protein n=1 Tax=Neotoma lepida TaxID=56216 RepID=A0A1A6HI16_NEOLE|nr:hypothetical protein A6R68_16259 [Neotoma lepida]